jgi:hypothetical protein
MTKEERKIYMQEWRENNKEKIAEYNKLKKTKEYITKKNRNYYLIHKEDILKKNLNLHNKKYNTDPLYTTSKLIRNGINTILKNNGFKKKSKTADILGCSFEEFKLYLESKFEPWMNWDNRGNPKDGIFELNKTWDIDHIIPISIVTCEADIIRLNHYTNLQPLCSYTNRWLKRGKT